MTLRRRTVVRALAALLALATLSGIAAVIVASRGVMVDPARFARPDDGVVVLDRHGDTLRTTRVEGADRRWVPLAEVSPSLIAAVIAVEDKDFYRHRGVDPRAIVRSAARDLLPWHRLSGASTLTQQLVKLVYGRRGGLWAKGVEALRAISLEQHFSKDEILEQYLNRVPYGDGIVGVERASEAYFGHPASALTPAEAALLAGIPQAPSVTEPRRHLARALSRRDFVLHRMHAVGALSDESLAAALAERPVLAPTPARPYFAARFVDAALDAMRAGQLIRDANTLTTSLDLSLQRETETLLAAAVDRFDARGAHNAAAVVVRNLNGEVLAYVGAARETPDARGGALDLLRARRQPGSTLKPFVYELLFERGATSATVLDDVSAPMFGAHGSTFDARDYDGHERGPVRARLALSGSLNLAALDAARRVGADAIVQRLRMLGVRVPEEGDRYGAAVVLGGADVSALELARAYATIARGGVALPLAYAPLPHAPRPTGTMLPSAVAVVRDILRDGDARREGFGDDLTSLTQGAPFLLKTGTSTGWRDAWAAVASDHLTVVVWMGDPAGNPMREVSGFEASAPVAARILAAAERRASSLVHDDPVATLPALVTADVCPWTGLRPGPRCRHTVHERFVQGTLPHAVCDAHDRDGAYVLPARLHHWAETTHATGVTMRAETDHPQEAPVVPVILEPRANARWRIDPQAPPVIELRARVGDALSRDVRWELDGRPLASASWQASVGRHTLVALHGSTRSAPVEVTVSP